MINVVLVLLAVLTVMETGRLSSILDRSKFKVCW